MKHLNLSKGYIGVEGNKPDAIEKLKKLISDEGLTDKIEVVTLQTTYPQGAERVMIYEITGKTMRAGVLPAALGVILSNVTSIAFDRRRFCRSRSGQHHRPYRSQNRRCYRVLWRL